MCEAFASSVASNILSKLGEYLFFPIGRQFGYVLCYKSYVQDLELRVEKLETARNRVQSDVDEAVYGGKPIHTDITKWLYEVANKAKEAQDLLKHGDSAKEACFRRGLPNPVVRHPIGRKVKKMIPVIQGLNDESKNDNFKKVYFESPPIGIASAWTLTVRYVDKEDDLLESRATMIKDVVEAITDDKVHVVGVWGPGGVGKSKLLEDVERRIKEQKMFDVVVKANVSRNPDLKRIQGEIAFALGLKLLNEETAHGRANLLYKRLDSEREKTDPDLDPEKRDFQKNGPKKKILIILDNLWEKLELKDVGIPCGNGNKVRDCKLLLTSRYRELLHIHMGSDRELQLNELKQEEARRLFEKTVGDKVNDPDFEPWVAGVVKNCGGWPLSIVQMATKLKDEELPAWRNASTNRDLSDFTSQVQLSYNDLKDERIKSLFLICALTSGRIPMRDCLIYCMGLCLYGEFSNTLQNVRDKLIGDLKTLHHSSLLLESDDPEQVRMHDIYVDVANSMPSKFMGVEWKPLVGSREYGFNKWSEEEKLKKCTAISLSYVGIDELPEKMDCPSLRILLLFENDTSLRIPESFFESMEKLQVLHLAGLSFTSLTSSIQCLGHLKSLALDSCHLEDVTILGELKRLQFLSFAGSRIVQLPTEIGKIKGLRFLDLRGCFGLEIIQPGVLKRLINLEELYIDAFYQWEAEDKAPRSNASLTELKSMKKLRILYIAIPQTANLSSDLPFENLHEHRIIIGGSPFWWRRYKESRTLELKLDSDNLLREEWMEQCLERTQELRVAGLQDGSDSIHGLCIKGFKDLKHLDVENSLSFQYVVDSRRRPAFTRLESLVLGNLGNLKKICCDCLAPESFSKLKTVIVQNCSATKQLFPSSAMRIFQQLEEITITRCCLMEQIIGDAKTEECGNEINDDANVKACQLRTLTLRNLPEMTSFYKTGDHSNVFLDGQQVSLPWLESLTLSELPKLKHIWNSELPLDVSKLKFLEVKGCAFLLSIIPSNLLTELQSLEAITVENCQLIREVFNFQRPTVSQHVKILSRLTTLTFSNLPRLEHIWNTALCFQNLRVLKVQNCESLRFIFSSSMVKTLQHIKEIKIENCKLLEEIIDVQEEESEEAALTGTIEFPLLTSLYLEELPNLRTFSYGKYHVYFPTLTKLRISGCPKMMTFSSFERKQQTKTAATGLQRAFGGINSSCSLSVLFNNNVEFPNMESMKISHMDNMDNIWPDEIASNAFSKLKTLVVEHCEKLSSIMSSFTMFTRFQNLEKIIVTECGSLEAVFHAQEFNPSKAHSTSTFQLRELVLKRLPKLKHVWSGLSQGYLMFGHFERMKVYECESLECLFPSPLAKSMTWLQVLTVQSCGVEEIIMEEEGAETSEGGIFFPQLAELRLLELPKFRSFHKNIHTSRWPLLKLLRVRHCAKMRSFSFACGIQSCQGNKISENIPTLFPFEKVMPKLKGVTLTREDVAMLRWQQHYTFGNLRELALSCFHDENDVFPFDFLLQSFPILEELNVMCSSFEEIFPEDASGHGRVVVPYEELTDMQRPLKSLGNLNLLWLYKLGNLRRVWKDGSLMAQLLKQIGKLYIGECPSLSIILPSQTSFQRLTLLEVFDCDGVVHMGTCSAVTTLVHLTVLFLKNCSKMEDVVTDDGNGVEEISFPKLQQLTLDGLPSLKSFSTTNSAFRFPSLERILVQGCPKVNIFCMGALTTPNLDRVFLSYEKDEWRWEGDLNTTIRTLST